jgi:prepilin-type N-terminal cleavage/methylation domain-containing protein
MDVASRLNNNLHPMKSKRSVLSRGFTLVEIMIVVAIIALLAAIAVPNFLRARKRSQATRCLEDLRILDNALDEYAIETNKISGFNPSFADLKNYIKTGNALYSAGDNDLFGNTYGTYTVDSPPKISAATFNSLSDVAPAAFWSPYR